MTPVQTATGTRIPEQRSSFRRALERVKAEVPITAYACELTELKPAGNSLRGRCPIHDGDNENAFAVYPSDGRWYCFRCATGGDVLDLCELVEHHADTWTALVSLCMRFGVDVSKPQAWRDWQDEKGKRRHMARKALAAAYQRRLFKLYGTYLEEIPDPEERREEGIRFWHDLRPLAWHCATRRVEQ